MKQKTLLHLEKEIKNKLKNVSDNSHGIKHAERVRSNSLKICDLLGVTDYEVDRNLMQFICLVHDLTYTLKEPNIYTYVFERKIIKNYLKKYLESIEDLTNKEKETIINAVKNHPHSFPFRRLNKNGDLYSKILQDSDTLDLFRKKRQKQLIKEYPFIMFPLIPLYNLNPKGIKNFLNIPEAVNLLEGETKKFVPYIEWNKDKKRKLVIIPGYADDLTNFEPLKNILNNRHIILVKLPTYRNFHEVYKMKDIVKYIDYVINHKLKEDFDLLGFSFGGLSAVEYAKNNLNRVKSLLLLNSWPDFSERYTNIQRDLIFKLSKLNFIKGIIYFLFKSDRSRDLFGVPKLSDLKKKNYETKFYTLIENLSYTGEETFNKLDLKKLIMLSKEDSFIPVSKYLKHGMVNNNFIKILDHGGHVKNEVYWNNLKKPLLDFYK